MRLENELSALLQPATSSGLHLLFANSRAKGQNCTTILPTETCSDRKLSTHDQRRATNASYATRMPLRPSPSLGHLALATLVVVGTSASVPDVNAARRAELDRNPVAAMPVWVSVPATRGLVPAQLAVVINSADTQSVIVGKAYVAARHVPAANVVTLNFSTGAILSSVEFAKVRVPRIDRRRQCTPPSRASSSSPSD